MKKEIEYSIKKFTEALTKLEEGVLQATKELEKDGVIQRFEFTFELFWKCLKTVLEDKGIACKSPKDCLKEAFRMGIITDESAALNMLDDRNKMSHIYSKEESEKIFQRIKNIHVPHLKVILDSLARI